MLTPGDEIIRYDGRTLALATCPLIRVEAHRGRRWGWFGRKGWWVHLRLFQNWHVRKFVLTLSEAGVFLKQDTEACLRLEESLKHSTASDSSIKSQRIPFLMF